jgi:DNA polymerase-3 subunit beta
MLRLVATDGHRLAVKEMAVDADKTGEYIVPLKTVEELGRLIKDSVTVSVGNNQIVFETGNVELISRLVAGQYVSYKLVIPSTFQANVTVNRDDFLATLDRAGIFEDKLGPKVTLQVAPDRLEVYAESYDVGRMEDSLPADADNEMRITFNARYLAEPLRAMVGDKVTLHLTGPQSAGVIQEEGYTYLVMPITKR